MFSLTGGYVYLNAEQTGGGRATFQGWNVVPQYHITPSWSVIAEAAVLYGSPDGKSTNLHGYTAGPVYAFANKTIITPFVFTEGGAVRTSTPGSINYAFLFYAGFGVEVKLVSHMSLQLIPAEYVLSKPPTGPLNNYAAHVALTFDFGSK